MTNDKDDLVSNEIARTQKYYDYTRRFYKYFWHGDTNAIHYGYFDEKATNLKSALIRTIEKTVQAAKIENKDKVVDLGCGVGGTVFFIAKEVGANTSGITISQEQYKKAQQLRSRLSLEDKTEFVNGDYFKTPYDNSSFDVAISIEASCYAHYRIDEFTKEVSRIVRSGGRIAIADGFRGSRNLSSEDEDKLKVFEEGVAVNKLITSDEFMESLRKNGFTNVSFEDWTQNMIPTARYMEKMIKRWYPVVKFLRWFRIIPELLVKNHQAGFVQRDLVERRVMVYGCITATKE